MVSRGLHAGLETSWPRFMAAMVVEVAWLAMLAWLAWQG